MTSPSSTLIRLFDAWASGDADTYVDCFADAFESVHPLGRTSDRGHIRKEIDAIVEHWTDRSYRVLSCISEGEQVALEYEMSMTGRERGFSGTITLPGLVMATIRDDRIVSYREEFDPRIVLAARTQAGGS